MGLTDQGFEADTIDEILARIEQKERAQISTALDTSSASVVGQMNGIVAAEAADGWEALRGVYRAKYPKSASGTSLDNVCSITGTKRNGAEPTIVPNVQWTVAAGFSAAPRTLVASVAGDATRRFVNEETVSNPGGSPAPIEVNAVAETAGAVPCLAGQLTVIAEPVTGWTAVTNPEDGAEGSEIDTDPQLRIRRVAELTGGATTADAIRAGILRDVSLGVEFCRVLVNEGDSTDANGVPGHSIEVIAFGPESPTSDDNQALVDKIFALKGGGRRAVGNSSGQFTDGQGNEFTVGYTRPTKLPIYLELDVTLKTDNSFPEDGDAQLKLALVAVGDGVYQPGDGVIAERLKASGFTVDGVKDTPALRLGLSASPVGTSNLTVGMREIADLDTSRIVITHV